jgi:hypothetical protein
VWNCLRNGQRPYLSGIDFVDTQQDLNGLGIALMKYKFSYNSLCAMWKAFSESLLEIPLRINVKRKIYFPQ